jgi:hypothetical protein
MTADQYVPDLDDEADYGPPCSTATYARAAHTAQVRLANAGEGLGRIGKRVRNGVLPHESLEAAQREYAAAQRVLGLVHATPVGFDPAEEVLRAVFGEWPISSDEAVSR